MILDVFGILTVCKISGNKVHGTRSVKSNNSDNIFKVMGLHIDHKRSDTARFTLENAEGTAFTEHFINTLVVNINLHNVESRVFFVNHFNCVINNGKSTKTEEVHFEKSEGFNPSLVILSNNRVTALEKRNIFVNRLVTDNNTCGVHACISGHTFNFD